MCPFHYGSPTSWVLNKLTESRSLLVTIYVGKRELLTESNLSVETLFLVGCG